MYVIDSETTGAYSENEQIEFLSRSIESSLCDYSDAYILVTGNITSKPNIIATPVAFKNCAPLKDCRTEIKDTYTDLLILQCLCKISLNIVAIILIHLVVYWVLKEMR